MPVKKETSAETPKDYFYRVLKAKQDGEEWARKIPCDSIVYFADQEDIEKLKLLLNVPRIE